jgi:thiosulfate reductase / polysulfide reductase chain A
VQVREKMEKTVRTVCQACHAECGVIAHVADGKVTKIVGDPNHPMNRGFICVKARSEPERLYHPDRLKYPLRRAGERGAGKWERISWDNALDGIAEKLTEVKEKYGPEAIATIHGTGPRSSINATLLPLALGSPNRISVDLHICLAPTLAAEFSTMAAAVTGEDGPDYLSSNCIVVWGGNPLASHPPRGMDILEARRTRNTKLIVIDPFKTTLAERADLWLQVRPGTDVALALGMLHVIITEHLYDEEFVNSWCFGFDKLRARVKEYTPERVGEITWVDKAAIGEAARMYATTKPASLHHRIGVEQNVNSTQTDRALAILIAITGNLDARGGNLLPTHIHGSIPTFALSVSGPWLRWCKETEWKRIGAREFPLISGPDATIPFVTSFHAFRAIDTGQPYPLRALYCSGANPVINVQNSKWVWNTLKKLDFFAVADFFMTPSAELADYVLPVTTWLETDEPCDINYMNYIAARQKAVEPVHEAWDNVKIVLELIKRIPWADRKLVPWDTPDECYEWLYRDADFTFEQLKQKGYVVQPPRYKKYEQDRFATPSGKVELFSTILEKYGYDPLPYYKEPPEGPVSTPEMMKDYPYILITGSRKIEFFASEGRQIPTLRKGSPDPQITLHPDTAKQIGVTEGDWVWVETPKVTGERVRLKATITDRIRPEVVQASYGWWFPEMEGPEHGCFVSNINVVLAATPPWDEICCSVPTRGTICKVSKCEEKT